MISHGEFHDGSFDGVWISEPGLAFIFLTADGGRRVTAVLTGLLRLNVAGFKQGNIILDLIVRDRNEATLQDIAYLCDLEDAHEPEAWESALLEQVRREGLQILQIAMHALGLF